MDEEQMELMRVLLYNAIVAELRTPYRPQGYNGEPKTGFNRRGSVATGQLINDLTVEWDETPEGNFQLVVSFPTIQPSFLPNIIDEGRRPSTNYPPLAAIEAWVRVKPVFFRDARGKFTRGTVKQRAFLVARSIKEKGFKGRFFLDKAENKVINQLEKLGEDAMANYFQQLIENQFVNLL
jgi:hypothetical protein